MNKIFIIAYCSVIHLFSFAQTPTLLKDINPGHANSIGVDFRIRDFANYGLFKANDGVNGFEFWKTDGTLNGTNLIADINPGTGSSFGQFIDTVNGYLICRAADSLHGIEFFSFDNNLNPQLLYDINPGVGNVYFDSNKIWKKNNKFYFVSGPILGYQEIWMTDGTTAGTEMLSDIRPGPLSSWPHSFTANNNSFLFVADDSIHSTEIWITDGTAPGTNLLKDINLNGWSISSNPFQFKWNNIFYFAAVDYNSSSCPSSNSELFRTDGTTSGTNLLKDINLNGWSISSDPFQFKWNDIFYFAAVDYNSSSCPSSNSELFRTDGTTSGTYKVKEIHPTCPGSYPSDFFSFKNNFYFHAFHPSWGRELWKSDGTDSGTVLLMDINPNANTGSSFIEYLWQDSTYFYFMGGEFLTGRELWKSDGVNTNLIIDINPDSAHGVIDCCYELNNLHFFIGNDSLTGNELWVSDGTTAGTFMLVDINPGPATSISQLINRYVWKNNQYLFFQASSPMYGNEIWRTDGTIAGTTLLKDITPGSTGTYITYHTEFNNEYFFVADNSLTGLELWKTDGSTAGTRLVKDIIPGPIGAFANSACRLDVFRNGSYFYFTAGNVVSNNVELWRTDGTDTGTTILAEICPDTIGSFPKAFNVYNNNVYFAAYNDSTGIEPYKINLNPVPGIHEINSPKFYIYPNPSSGTFRIYLESSYKFDFQILDISGREIYRAVFNNEFEYSFPENVSNGIYLIRLINSKQVMFGKIIITE